MNNQRRDQPLLPAGIPLLAVLVIGVLVFSFSRILLASDTAVAPILALGLALGILLLATAVALSPGESMFYLGGFAVIGAIAIIAVGIVLAATGDRPAESMGIVGGLVAALLVSLTLVRLRQTRDEEEMMSEGIPRRPIIGGAMVAAVLAAVVIFGLAQERSKEPPAPTGTATATAAATQAPGAATTPAAGATTLQVAAMDNFFEPIELTAKAGETVSIVVTNGGLSIHNFVIQSTGVNSGILNGGDSVTLTVTMPDSGSLEFICEFHPPDMKGTIATQ